MSKMKLTKEEIEILVKQGTNLSNK